MREWNLQTEKLKYHVIKCSPFVQEQRKNMNLKRNKWKIQKMKTLRDEK